MGAMKSEGYGSAYNADIAVCPKQIRCENIPNSVYSLKQVLYYYKVE